MHNLDSTYINSIIDNANKLKKMNRSELEIAKFVHIALGKYINFNNNYSANFEQNNENIEVLTELSKQRLSTMLKAPTNINSSMQICKGMSEIYSAILNKLNIESYVIGVKNKGDVDGDIREDNTIIRDLEKYSVSLNENNNLEVGDNQVNDIEKDAVKHYYSIFKIDNQEYIQDFLIDYSLTRLKIEEHGFEAEMPGICKKEEYKRRALKSLAMDYKYKENIIKKFEKEIPKFDGDMINAKMDFVFKESNKVSEKFGFEECNDFFNIYMKVLLTEEEKSSLRNELKYANMVNENSNECEVISLYNYKGHSYLVKRPENISVKNNLGEISREGIQDIVNSGYVPRKNIDSQVVDKLVNKNLDIKREDENER